MAASLARLSMTWRVSEPMKDGAAPISAYSCPGSPVCTQYGRPRQVDSHLHQRLVERHERVAEADDPGLVTEGLAQRLTEHDRGVLDGVVRVDVAGRPRR